MMGPSMAMRGAPHSECAPSGHRWRPGRSASAVARSRDTVTPSASWSKATISCEATRPPGALQVAQTSQVSWGTAAGVVGWPRRLVEAGDPGSCLPGGEARVRPPPLCGGVPASARTSPSRPMIAVTPGPGVTAVALGTERPGWRSTAAPHAVAPGWPPCPACRPGPATPPSPVDVVSLGTRRSSPGLAQPLNGQDPRGVEYAGVGQASMTVQSRARRRAWRSRSVWSVGSRSRSRNAGGRVAVAVSSSLISISLSRRWLQPHHARAR